MNWPRVVIVGAGLAGLACADVLASAGLAPRLLDKGRGPGGRCASRRSPAGRFDHGAPSLVVSRASFEHAVARWIEAGVADVLDHPFATASTAQIVGVPAMNSFVKHEAERLDAEFSVEVAAPRRQADAWELFSVGGQSLGFADLVILAIPAPQAVDRLPPGPLRDAAAGPRFDPVWTLMAAFDEGDGAPLPDADDMEHPVLDKIIWQEGRPRREQGRRCTAHACPAWSLKNLERPKDEVAQDLLSALQAFLPTLGQPTHLDAHRWRYARVARPVGTPFGYDPATGLATCGDWHLGPNAEDAWESGHALGHAIIENLS